MKRAAVTVLDVAAFVWRWGRLGGFRKWSASSITDLMNWHFCKGSLVVVEDAGNVRGVLAYSVLPDDVPIGSVDGELWRRDAEGGRRLYIAALVGVGARVLGALVDAVKARLPGWRSMEVWAHRRGRLIRYTPRTLERLSHAVS